MIFFFPISYPSPWHNGGAMVAKPEWFRREVEGAEREASARRYYLQASGHSYDAEAASSVNAQLPARERPKGAPESERRNHSVFATNALAIRLYSLQPPPSAE
jgi:hypothetical protein